MESDTDAVIALPKRTSKQRYMRKKMLKTQLRIQGKKERRMEAELLAVQTRRQQLEQELKDRLQQEREDRLQQEREDQKQDQDQDQHVQPPPRQEP